MPFGFSIKNIDGVTQVDELNKVMEIEDIRDADVAPPNAFNPAFVGPASYHIFPTEKTYVPLVFVKTKPRVNNMWGYVSRRSVSWSFNSTDGNATDFGDVKLYIMRPLTATPSRYGYGLEIYDASGQLTFTSNMPLLNIQYLNYVKITTSSYTTNGGNTMDQYREDLLTTPALSERPLILLNNLRPFHWGIGGTRDAYILRARWNADNSVTYRIYKSLTNIGTTFRKDQPYGVSLALAIVRN